MKTDTCDTSLITRRALLQGGAALAMGAILPFSVVFPARAMRGAAPRDLTLHNLHTSEICRVTYFEHGKYVPGALEEINHVLRDHRTGDVHAMDRDLLDLLHRLRVTLGTEKPYQIISGYRSPASNAKLHAHSSGVAKRSMHMEGKATDIRVEGLNLAHLRDAAKSLHGGGVGYYPESQFVHVDTGKIRYW